MPAAVDAHPERQELAGVVAERVVELGGDVKHERDRFRSLVDDAADPQGVETARNRVAAAAAPGLRPDGDGPS